MKKCIVSVAIMLITIALLITSANATFTASISMKSDSSTVKVGDTVTLTISVNEKIVASNFDINYDSAILKLEGSGTSNLSVAEKDGKIACIYADMSGTGTSEFKVKFKALKETTGANLKIENAKFRAEGKEESYTGEQISGINNAITVKVGKVESTEEKTPSNPSNPTTSSTPSNPSTPSTSSTGNQVAGKDKTTTKTSNLPKTGKETGFVIAGIAVLVIVAIVFGKKSKELSKIFSSLSVFVIALVAVASLSKGVYAADENPKIIYNNRLIGEEYIMAIMLDKNDSDRKITKSELMALDTTINDITHNGESISSTDVVKTGDKVKLQNYTYTVVLYGDSNEDGIICDADDLMTIINDYLGKEELQGKKKLAANLMNTDDKLDADDLMQMINMYLGKIEKTLVTNPPRSAIYPNTQNDKEYLDTNWEYSTEFGSNIVLKKYIGKDSDVTIKEYYNIDGTQYKTRMGETTTYNPVFGTEAYGPFVDNGLINSVTFESTNILQGDISCLFYQCINLKRVIGFGGNITNMDSAFTRCTSLLNEKNKNSLYYVEGAEIDIPDSVENLDFAFMECSSIQYIPNINSSSKLKTAKSAFYGCNSARSGTIYLPETVSNIANMFYDCHMLGNYDGSGFKIYSYMIPDNVTANGAFERCGIVITGGGGYGSEPHEFIVKNATSETDETFIFFKDLIENSYCCTLTVKIE